MVGMAAGEKKISSAKDKVFSGSGRTDKLRYQTTKIMSGLKAAQSAFSVKRYSEHKDGVWEVRLIIMIVSNITFLTLGLCQQTRSPSVGYRQC